MNLDDTARFFGASERLWPQLFAPPTKTATMLCRDCHKAIVPGIKRYCGRCARIRKLTSNRESYRNALRRKTR
jgi:hypothetical protein